MGFCYSDQLLKGSKSVHTAKLRSPEPATVTRAMAEALVRRNLSLTGGDYQHCPRHLHALLCPFKVT